MALPSKGTTPRNATASISLPILPFPRYENKRMEWMARKGLQLWRCTSDGSMTGIRPYPPAAARGRREKSNPIAAVSNTNSHEEPKVADAANLSIERATDVFRIVFMREKEEEEQGACGVRDRTLSRSRVKRERTRCGSWRTRTTDSVAKVRFFTGPSLITARSD